MRIPSPRRRRSSSRVEPIPMLPSLSPAELFVFEFRLPALCALRYQIEEMPDRTEVVARAKTRIRDSLDPVALALEDRHARNPTVAFPITHVRREVAAFV